MIDKSLSAYVPRGPGIEGLWSMALYYTHSKTHRSVFTDIHILYTNMIVLGVSTLFNCSGITTHNTIWKTTHGLVNKR